MISHLMLLPIAIAGMAFWSLRGSRPSDLQGLENADNPLRPCPDSPNCIRISRKYDAPLGVLFDACRDSLDEMGPKQMKIDGDQHRIEAVFRVFLFHDDMVLQLTENNPTSTCLHMRSASRVGESDLGVNRRRVRTFLQKLERRLQP